MHDDRESPPDLPRLGRGCRDSRPLQKSTNVLEPESEQQYEAAASHDIGAALHRGTQDLARAGEQAKAGGRELLQRLKANAESVELPSTAEDAWNACGRLELPITKIGNQGNLVKNVSL